jgi:hypothetical protein
MQYDKPAEEGKFSYNIGRTKLQLTLVPFAILG